MSPANLVILLGYAALLYAAFAVAVGGQHFGGDELIVRGETVALLAGEGRTVNVTLGF